ncbi:MAG: DUF4345 domain-containing protein [Gammaproteobacteria bacterium]
MAFIHTLILYSGLGVLGIGLVLPGLMEIFKNVPVNGLYHPATVDAKNQLRALNGMMTGVGLMAIWICFDLEASRQLVIGLGSILLTVAAARLLSFVIDGIPSPATWAYMAVELILGGLFLLWPPYR